MGFYQAIASVVRNYAVFRGRAPRSEFWFWQLFYLIMAVCLGIFDQATYPLDEGSPFASIFGVLALLPGLTVWVRRLHDINRSGWWLLLLLVPFVLAGILILMSLTGSGMPDDLGAFAPFILISMFSWVLPIAWAFVGGTDGENRFGGDPLAARRMENT